MQVAVNLPMSWIFVPTTSSSAMCPLSWREAGMLKSLNCAGRRTEKPPLVERAVYQPSASASPASFRCITSEGGEAAHAVVKTVAIAMDMAIVTIDREYLRMADYSGNGEDGG